MKLQDLGLQRSFLQKVILDDPNYKNYYALRKLFADYLTKLNVPFYDTCCPTASIPDSYPMRYFDGDVQYFDGTEWVNITLETGGFTEGSVLFASSTGTIIEDNPSFFYDNNNNRLGIGTSSPQAALHVVGTKAIIDSIDIYSSGTYTGVIPFTDGIGSNSVVADETNTSIGFRASLNTTGVFNVALGIRSQENPNVAGSQAHNTSVGAYSLRNISQYGNTVMGSCTMHASTSFYTSTAIGAFALGRVTNSAGTNGFNTRGITAVGYLAMGRCTAVGEWTTAVGFEAGTAFNGGSTNTAIGAFSMGAGSSVLGGTGNLTGTQNTGLGVTSLYSLTTGTANIGIGANAGRNATTNTQSIFIGYQAGLSVVTGDYNVIIGGHAGASISGLNNHILLADGQGNQRLLINNSGAYEIGGGYGAAGEILTSNGNAAAPTWQAPPAAVTTSSAYTPTLTNSTNISASTAYLNSYYQIGDVVTVQGRVSITPTAGAWTQTILRMTIPVASTFTANEEAGGTASAINIQGNNGNNAGIRARAAGTDVEFVWLANDTNAHDFFFTFSYQVIIP